MRVKQQKVDVPYKFPAMEFLFDISPSKMTCTDCEGT